METSLTYLLKTCLAKTAKDTATLATTLDFPESTERVQKHISMVFDRIAKGSRLDFGTTAAAAVVSGSSKSSAPSGKEEKSSN